MKFSRSEPTNTGDWRIEEDVRLESRDFFEIKAMSKSAGTNKWKGGISHHRSSSITMGNGGNTMGKPSLTHAYTRIICRIPYGSKYLLWKYLGADSAFGAIGFYIYNIYIHTYMEVS